MKTPSNDPQPNGDPSSAGEKLDQDFLNRTQYMPDAVADSFGGDQPAPSSPDPADLISPQLIESALGPTFQALFHAIASKRGEHWQLSEFEKTALVKGWTPILQHMLAKLGNQEQVLLSLAIMSTSAIVGGKMVQDTKLVLLKANTRTPASAASSVSSGSGIAEKPLAPSNSFSEEAA